MREYKVTKESLKFLEKMLNIPSPSGFEADVQHVYIDNLKPYVDEFKTDVIGNVAAVKNPDAKFKIMLAAHCDQVGLMVQYVDNNGFLMVNTIGGADLSTYAGRMVRVKSNNGKWIPAVIQRKGESFSKEQIYNIENYYLDIGVSTKSDALKVVSPGAPVVVDADMTKLSPNRFSAAGFDDKAGVFVLAETMRILADSDVDIGVYAVSTVMEEVGTCGAGPASFGINPDVGIAVDVNREADYPAVPKKIVGDVSLGNGAVLVKGINVNRKLDELLTSVAEDNNIKVQISPWPGMTGTDARTIQLSREGVATALVKIPLRYMHSPAEVLDIRDLEESIKLLSAFILSLKPDMDFRPVKI